MSTRAHTVPRFYLHGFTAEPSTPAHEPFLYVGQIANGEIIRRAPKNLSICSGYYDGVGAFAEPDASVEAHLSKVECAAASAIRRLSDLPHKLTAPLPADIFRFIAWQAVRTPGWMELEANWAAEWDPNDTSDALEPPPDGYAEIKDRPRAMLLEHPSTGATRVVDDIEDYKPLYRDGWRWRIGPEERLEMMHMQAWYLKVRHFARLQWTLLNAPMKDGFITSDRAVAWIVDGYANTPPSALRHHTAQVVAPLTSEIALVGRHNKSKLNVTPREVNRFVAVATASWIAGPSQQVVEQALADRSECFADRPRVE